MEGGKFIQSPTTNSPVAPKSPLKPPKSPTKSSPGMLAKKKTYSTSSERVFQTGLRTVYTAGRPPWYDSHGTQKEAFLIGVCGGSASGKTTVARRIIEALDVPWVSLLSLDSFYKVLDEKQHQLAAENEYNFDHPDAFDYELLGQTLKRLKSGKKVEVPIYNFITHSREDTSVSLRDDVDMFPYYVYLT
ncbi:hypothetical protein FSP39_001983 [Pinctada imbricata]|uniref:Phosphoribulokinase/uridine kinase domain-containing protein n=1 Tax=Pinctada imbricata TaxID=66713 RepID=A0AA88XPD5_PINIB|nr:hypothetical protein FSP39_001983 [Pinctada imbricata]